MPAATRNNTTAILIIACMAQFMVILDVSVVNVALPAIRHALRFTEADLQWVVNAYTVTFAGFLLLGGRAADLLGRRRVFVTGMVVFAGSSLLGGISDSQTLLIIARLAQGLGGAIIAPASLAILTTTFTDPKERNRAIGIWGSMAGAGGAAGVLAGGVITDLLSWRWILFINVPIGVVVAILATRMVAEGNTPHATRNFDFLGALTATGGLSLLVYGIVRTTTTGWGDTGTLALIAGGLVVIGLFLLIEGRFAAAPLMPLRLFTSRSLSAANVIIMTVGGSTFAMWFFYSLYLQQVQRHTPLQAGLIFLPMTVAIILGSQLAGRSVMRFGAKRLLIFGMVVLSAGLLLFTDITAGGSYLTEGLLPSLLVSIGMPFAFIPGTISATSGVPAHEAGLASGVVNTSRMFGGALGLAVLATIATSRTNHDLREVAHPSLAASNHALVAGFQLGFSVAAAIGLVGVLVAVFLTPTVRVRPALAAEIALEV
jgi:EmrB/QacA subfamily drug resistance transporter